MDKKEFLTRLFDDKNKTSLDLDSFKKKEIREMCLDVDEYTVANEPKNLKLIYQDVQKSKYLNLFFEYSGCSSFSSKDYHKAKIVIVGTITPWNGKGFFYTAPNTKMYQIIDKILGTHFDQMKNCEELETALENKGIYFLDVFQAVIRKRKSASDDDILFGSLNYNAFEEYMNHLNNDVIVVANSDLAHQLCERILKRVNNGKHLCLLQKEVHTIFRKKPEVMVDDWKPVFKKAKF